MRRLTAKLEAHQGEVARYEGARIGLKEAIKRLEGMEEARQIVFGLADAAESQRILASGKVTALTEVLKIVSKLGDESLRRSGAVEEETGKVPTHPGMSLADQRRAEGQRQAKVDPSAKRSRRKKRASR